MRISNFVYSLLINSVTYQVGLLYDDISLQNVVDMIADWTAEERQMVKNEAMPFPT